MRSECIVFIYLPGSTTAVPAGMLTISQQGRDIASTFVYGSVYRKRIDAVSLDPMDLPLPERDGEVLRPQGGRALFGVFRDAAPDAWGRLVINDRFIKHHKYELGTAPVPNMVDLPEMEYLLRSRPDRVGNLDFREKPTDLEPTKRISHLLHLKDLVREAHRIANHKPALAHVTTLMCPATGMGGARPKTTVEDNGILWLAKFPMQGDTLPVPRIEHAMLKLASCCGIQTIESRLVDVEGLDEPVFMIRRFDCQLQVDGSYTRTGYISSLTALGREEFDQSLGTYQDIARHLHRFADGKTQAVERRELFRRMAFNVLVNNDDDHLRNHGLLRLAGGRSSLSPVFDIVPRSSIPGVSSTRRLAIGIGKNGRDGTIENILSDVAPFGLSHDEAIEELRCVASHVAANWRRCLKEAGCSKQVVVALANTMSMAEQVLKEIGQLDDECATGLQVRPDRARETVRNHAA